jgi:hypothetical protein
MDSDSPVDGQFAHTLQANLLTTICGFKRVASETKHLNQARPMLRHSPAWLCSVRGTADCYDGIPEIVS